MAQHAKLSCSSASRWLRCTPSVHFSMQHSIVSPTSKFAQEGTKAHENCERALLGEAVLLNEYEQQYVDFIRARPADQMFIEQKVTLEEYIPEGFGTVDCILIREDELDIIDLKYGMGVPVKAQGNPQLRLYAYGAWKAAGYPKVKKINMIIVQPRLDSISEDTITPDELVSWLDNFVYPRAQKAFKGIGDFVVGSHCQFCPAKAICAGYSYEALQTSKAAFKNVRPAALPKEELYELVAQSKIIRGYLAECEKLALNSLTTPVNTLSGRIEVVEEDKTVWGDDVPEQYYRKQRMTPAQAVKLNPDAAQFFVVQKEKVLKIENLFGE